MKIRKKICSLLLVCLAFLGIFCGRGKCICRSETGIVGNGDTAETGKRLCRAGGDQKQWGGFSGKVRLVFSGTDNSSGCAFEQCLTLPQNGKNSIQ